MPDHFLVPYRLCPQNPTPFVPSSPGTLDITGIFLDNTASDGGAVHVGEIAEQGIVCLGMGSIGLASIGLIGWVGLDWRTGDRATVMNGSGLCVIFTQISQ